MNNEAKKRPCGTCKFFSGGYCESIDENVVAWWTGCVRHEPTPTPTPTKTVGAAILAARKLLPIGYTLIIEVVSENINVSLRTPHGVIRADLMRSVTCQIQELLELAVRDVER